MIRFTIALQGRGRFGHKFFSVVELRLDSADTGWSAHRRRLAVSTKKCYEGPHQHALAGTDSGCRAAATRGCGVSGIQWDPPVGRKGCTATVLPVSPCCSEACST
jgi:hypothetical protein